MLGCNRRYLAFLSALDDFSAGVRALDRLTQPRKTTIGPSRESTSSPPTEQKLLRALQRPGVQYRMASAAPIFLPLAMFSPTRLSRQLRRLRDIGVIKRVTGTYRYYLTKAAGPPRQPRHG